MTRKAMARRIAGPYLTSQQRGEAPVPPQPEGLRGFWAAALLLVGQRPQRVFSLLAPRIQPKFAAALLYQPQTWCSRPTLFISVMSLRSPVLGFAPVNQWTGRSQYNRDFAARGNVVVRRSVEPSRIDSSNSSKDFPQMVGPRIGSIFRGGGFCRRASPDGFLRITDSDRHRLSHGQEI